MMPGRTLHRLAARICSANTLERVVEPAIADLQNEFTEASALSRARRAWILVIGYVGVLEGIGMTLLSPAGGHERSALLRACLCALLMTIVVSALLIALTIAGTPVFAPFYIALLTPMTLPIALPIGLTLGIAFGLGHRDVSREARWIVLVTAIFMTVLSFASMARVMPVANQSFRQSVFNAIGGQGVVMKGLHEMSLSELQREMRMVPRGDAAETPARATWVYHLTFALPLAPLVLTVLALVLIGRGAQRAILLTLGIAYFIAAFAMEALVYRGLSPVVGAWLPNILFAAAAVILASSGSSRLRGSLSPAR